MKAVLYPNFQKKNALGCARGVCDVLHSEGIEVVVDLEFTKEFSDKEFVIFDDISTLTSTADIFIAIGGDGTILRCAKLLMGTETKLMGINSGTLGFMAALEADQLDALKKLKTGEYHISRRMTVEVIIHGEGNDLVYTALNEISAKSASFRICDFDVSADGYLIGKYRADGILFSTPSGSTAYALSAGGPVIEPDLECIEMNLICPHSLFAKATLFSANRKLRLTDRTSGENSLVLSVDGELVHRMAENESVEIMKGRYTLNFVDVIDNAFHDSLCRKMCKPIK
jgi:NAD+ kinase